MAQGDVTLDELRQKAGEAEWSLIRLHLDRDAVIVVASHIDIADAGLKLATDDAAAVKAWIGSGALAKPTPAQVAAWQMTPDKRFISLVVKPFVLVQEL